MSCSMTNRRLAEITIHNLNIYIQIYRLRYCHHAFVKFLSNDMIIELTGPG